MPRRIHASVARVALLGTMLVAMAVFARSSKGADPWIPAQLISPESLRQQLADSKEPKPLLIHVGFHTLYEQGHIPGSVYDGPGARPEGLAEIKKQVEKLPRNKAIVIYCGCCPWEECPNIRPAFKALKAMGFTRLKVLSLPTNFATDWAGKGYPVERGN
ncbi:MAG: rhodanese-like domain-containing protein [Acidobacteriia bacterium]|nr:rhodanese-like domain-containing protein [Terriglobia bacterium]